MSSLLDEFALVSHAALVTCAGLVVYPTIVSLILSLSGIVISLSFSYVTRIMLTKPGKAPHARRFLAWITEESTLQLAMMADAASEELDLMLGVQFMTS
jgi:hypothetical protein